MPSAAVERFGREVVGAQFSEGDTMVVEAEVPTGPQVYVPFTVGGTGAVVGRAVALGQTEAVRQIHARRTGARAVLTWVWPPDVRLVEVVWSVPGREDERQRLTLAQYKNGDGCVLQVGPGGGTAAVRSISFGPLGETFSAPVAVTVEGRAVQLSYSVRRPSSFKERFSRRRVVDLRADEDCSGVDLSVVIASGLAMPLRVEAGMTIFRFRGLRVSRQASMPLEFEIPAHVPRPYWIRCFVDQPSTVTLVDPPISDLKVS